MLLILFCYIDLVIIMFNKLTTVVVRCIGNISFNEVKEG